ncbi:MAG: hypothetical protein LBT13_00470 [Treponema sp.]|nr:hypothetical protein [Treponema sp.]
MKIYGKIAGFVLVMGLWYAGPVFAAESLRGLQDAVGNFSDQLAKSLPFNASLGLNWSDAYIGKLIGELPPHFGVGISGGLTTMDFDAFDDLVGYFGINMPFSLKHILIPAYAVEARVGGFFLPFDVGLKFGWLPQVGFGSDFTINYTLLGADFRYAVLDRKFLPKVSVGVGVNYLGGGFGTTINGMIRDFTFDSHTLSLTDPELGLSWQSTSLDFTAQVSKSIFIITPYLGLGLSHAWSHAGYTVNSALSYNDQPVTGDVLAALNRDLKNAGITGIDDLDQNGFSSMGVVTAWGLRVFGGISFNLAVLRLDITGMFNFFDANFGGTLGMRFQL